MANDSESIGSGLPKKGSKTGTLKEAILEGLQRETRTCRNDVTFYVRQQKDAHQKELASMTGVVAREEELLKGYGSYDLELDSAGLASVPAVELKDRGGTKWKALDFARLQVSSVQKRDSWSVTARIKYRKVDAPEIKSASLRSGGKDPKKPVEVKWQQPFPTPTDLGVEDKYLAGFGMTCKILYDVLNMQPNDSGLILVSGQTGSGKSEILRGVMHRYVEMLVQNQRRNEPGQRRNPHVLTFEDPIETLLLQRDGEATCFTDGEVDYTPRVKGVDAKDLKEVINSALRQKPALLFVGEIRDEEDIRQCLEFAGTGHLVFATTHAGSLLEGMQRAFNACDAHTPGTRAIWVPKIRAVVHLKNFDFPFGDSDGPGKKQVMLPAMYVNNALAQHALVSDGLAALLPCAPIAQEIPADAAKPRQAATGGCGPARCSDVKGALGRRYFARQMRNEMMGISGTVRLRLEELERTIRHSQGRRENAGKETLAALRDAEEERSRLQAVETAWKQNFQSGGMSAAGAGSLESAAISADLNGE